MAKLTAELRARAMAELRAGVKPALVATKFGISASACSYLKSQATGSNPAVTEFETEFSTAQRARLERLYKAGESILALAADYEVSGSVLKSYFNKQGIKPDPVIKVPTRKLIATKTKRKK